jgi:eukaryotic-like serine/threonine-protein kinase
MMTRSKNTATDDKPQVLEQLSMTPHVVIERGFWREQQVLIKRLKDMSRKNPEVLERFEREGEVMAKLDHPNIPKLLHLEPGMVVREWVEGRTLYYHIEEDKKLELPRVFNIARGVLAAVNHAHSRGVLHLDLKPGNIMLEDWDRVRVIDFGCAKDLTLESITHVGARLGTPNYMAPEQFKGTRHDVRSDVYSIGAIIYEMSVGQLPFSDAFAWLAGRGKPPTTWSEHPGLTKVLQKALQRVPESRFQTVLEMLIALEQLEVENP